MMNNQEIVAKLRGISNKYGDRATGKLQEVDERRYEFYLDMEGYFSALAANLEYMDYIKRNEIPHMGESEE